MAYSILFSGHMIDRPSKSIPRFPSSKEGVAAAAIRGAIARVAPLDLSEEIRGIAAAACGGDILFHEACRSLGVPSEVYLGISPDAFEKTSVAFAGAGWVERYRRLIRDLPVRVLFPKAKSDAGDEVWEKANEWMLKMALQSGGNELALIVLWDGQGGDRPGGTRHMVEMARRQGAVVEIIDVGRL